MHNGICVKVRGHHAKVSSLFHHVGPMDPTQVVKYGFKHFYFVGHLAGPHFNILLFLIVFKNSNLRSLRGNSVLLRNDVRIRTARSSAPKGGLHLTHVR